MNSTLQQSAICQISICLTQGGARHREVNICILRFHSISLRRKALFARSNLPMISAKPLSLSQVRYRGRGRGDP